jgi:hypothetical protein
MKLQKYKRFYPVRRGGGEEIIRKMVELWSGLMHI